MAIDITWDSNGTNILGGGTTGGHRTDGWQANEVISSAELNTWMKGVAEKILGVAVTPRSAAAFRPIIQPAQYSGGALPDGDGSLWAWGLSGTSLQRIVADVPAPIGAVVTGLAYAFTKRGAAAALTMKLMARNGATVTTISTLSDVTSAGALGTIIMNMIAKTLFVDGETFTITDGFGSTKIYEIDKAGDGVVGGHVQVNISTDTTAADVGARITTAITSNQPNLSVSGTTVLTITRALSSSTQMTASETVADAGFSCVASADSGWTAGTATDLGAGYTVVSGDALWLEVTPGSINHQFGSAAVSFSRNP